MGSLKELETQLIIGGNLGYIQDIDLDTSLTELNEIGKMLSGLINYVKNK